MAKLQPGCLVQFPHCELSLETFFPHHEASRLMKIGGSSVDKKVLVFFFFETMEI